MATNDLRADRARDNLVSADQTWQSLVDRLAEANAADASTFDNPDDAIEAAGRALDDVMYFPAPNAAAALWKLDWFMADGGTHTAAWSKDYLAQTIADYRRFLGEPARNAPPARATLAAIDALSHRVQDHARRVLALVGPARNFLDDAQVPFGEPFTETEGQLAEFADVLLAMVKETAATLDADGHQIEQLVVGLIANAQVQA